MKRIDSYHDEDKIGKQNPNKFLRKRNVAILSTLYIESLVKGNGQDAKGDDEQSLDADTDHVDLLAGTLNILAVFILVGKKRAARTLNEERKDVEPDEDLG